MSEHEEDVALGDKIRLATSELTRLIHEAHQRKIKVIIHLDNRRAGPTMIVEFEMFKTIESGIKNGQKENT